MVRYTAFIAKKKDVLVAAALFEPSNSAAPFFGKKAENNCSELSIL